MTGANVSNSLIHVAASTPTVNSGNAKASTGEFMQLMNNNMPNKDQTTSKMTQSSTSVQVQSKANAIRSSKNEPIGEEVATKITKDTEKFVEEMKDALCQEFDVSEEELEDAMEVLGLTFLDLTEYSNLVPLVSKLSESESNALLLTSDSFTDILNQVSELTQNLVQDSGLSIQDLKGLLEEIVDTVPSEEAVEMTTEEVEMETNPKQEVPREDADHVRAIQQEVQVAEESVVVESKEISQTVNTQTNNETPEIKEDDSFEEVVKPIHNEKSESSLEGEKDFMNFERQPREKEFVHLQGMEQQLVTKFEPMTKEITLPTGEVVQVKELMDQIVEAARTTISAGETKVEMLLQPEGLGKVMMELTQRDGKITAKIFTQNEEVKQAIENQMIQLKDQMSQPGSKVTSIEVAVGTHEFEKNLEENQQQRQQEEAENRQNKKNGIHKNALDELSGLMTEEEELVTRIMRENGNSVYFTA